MSLSLSLFSDEEGLLFFFKKKKKERKKKKKKTNRSSDNPLNSFRFSLVVCIRRLTVNTNWPTVAEKPDRKALYGFFLKKKKKNDEISLNCSG